MHGRSALAAAVAVGFLVASCGGGDDDAEDTPTGTTEVAVDGTDAGGIESGEDATDDQPTPTLDDDSDGSDGSDTGEGDAPSVTGADPAPVEPVVGGTFRFGLEADVDGLNPATSSLSSPGLVMANTVFDTLARYTPEGEPVPYLAESFTPNDDLMGWSIRLRSGITFHDGTPLDADALIVNYEAKVNDPLVGLAVRPFVPDTGAIEKIDDLTVRINLLEPHASYPAYMTTQLGLVASPTWLAAAAADPSLNQRPVGTGPFVFESRSEDSVTRFVRNDDWWGGDVFLDAVEFFPVPDATTRVDLLLGDELDGLHTDDPAAVLELTSEETIQNLLDDDSSESFAMMNTAAAPFDDIRARQALAHATPRQQHVDLIGLGVVRPADQRFTPDSPFYNPDVVQAADDPATAAARASEYCAERGDETNPITGGTTCTDGKINIELQFAGPAVVATRRAELLEEGWSDVFDVTFRELPQDEFIARAFLGQYNVNLWRLFSAQDPSQDNVWLLCRTIGSISLNAPRYCDEERDALLVRAQAEPDVDERARLYQAAEQRINDAFTYIFFNHSLWDVAAGERVRGLCEPTSPDGVPLACADSGRVPFASVWLD